MEHESQNEAGLTIFSIVHHLLGILIMIVEEDCTANTDHTQTLEP